jgi:hypothetical protein
MNFVYRFFSALALFVLVIVGNSSRAQDLDKATVQKLIESKNFVFKAQTVFPATGTARPLTPEFDVSVWRDSVISHLPYFGRAFNITYGSDAGIKFTSTDFDYKITPRKKGGWQVTLRPKDTREVRELNFIVSENGRTSLQVNSTNRQSISFNGYIEERK